MLSSGAGAHMIVVSEVQVFTENADQQVVRGELRQVDLPNRLRVEAVVAPADVERILSVMDEFAPAAREFRPGDRSECMTTPDGRRARMLALALVVAGGACGAASREGLSLAIPTVDSVPIVIPIVNVIGAFLLGLLYEALTRPTIDDLVRVRVKLLLGTGFCGAFTTYSSLATDTAVLRSDGRAGQAAVYAVSTLLVGGLATWLGLVCGARIATQRTEQAES